MERELNPDQETRWETESGKQNSRFFGLYKAGKLNLMPEQARYLNVILSKKQQNFKSYLGPANLTLYLIA